MTCVICGGELRKLRRMLYTGRPLPNEQIAECEQCDTAQVVPMPSREQLATLYTADYYKEFAGNFAGGTDEVPVRLKRRLAELKGRRILDLGCGIGLFVAYAKSKGWDAVGVEPARWAAEEGRRRLGVEIHAAALEEIGLPPDSFDVIHANHVIEHLPDPVGTLRTAAALLRPGGTLIAEVPQELQLPLGEAVIGAMRGKRPEPTGPYHVVFFSKRGLGIAAEAAGLTRLSVRNIRHRDEFRHRALPYRLRRWAFFAVEAWLGRAPAYVLTASR